MHIPGGRVRGDEPASWELNINLMWNGQEQTSVEDGRGRTGQLVKDVSPTVLELESAPALCLVGGDGESQGGSSRPTGWRVCVNLHVVGNASNPSTGEAEALGESRVTGQPRRLSGTPSPQNKASKQQQP